MQKNHEKFKLYWEHFASLLNLTLIQSQHLGESLFILYSESQRYYHTTQHVIECLEYFYLVKSKLDDPIAVELAIWFHDSIYDPKASDNELQSALFMQKSCEAYLDNQTIEKVYAWILATQKHESSQEQDLNYLLDIDLAILGSNSTRFLEYEHQIQKEYAWVDPDIYQVKRAEVLRYFYQMQPLYRTAFFREKLQLQAKNNLLNSLQSE